MFVAKFPVPPFHGAFPHRHEPFADEARRLVDATFVDAGRGAGAHPVFLLTNRSSKRLTVAEAWVFAYDASGRKLARYRYDVAGTVTLPPGGSKKTALGPPTSQLPPGTVHIEAEVTSAIVGGKRWVNDNLLGSAFHGRPVGGLSRAALGAMAGERVIIDVYALHSYRVRITNVSNRPVLRFTVVFFYYDRWARMLGRVHSDFHLPEPPGSGGLERAIAPGQSLDVSLQPDPGSPPVPRSAVAVVAYAPRVDYRAAGGTTDDIFENRNLDHESEP